MHGRLRAEQVNVDTHDRVWLRTGPLMRRRSSAAWRGVPRRCTAGQGIGGTLSSSPLQQSEDSLADGAALAGELTRRQLRSTVHRQTNPTVPCHVGKGPAVSPEDNRQLVGRFVDVCQT